MVPRIAATTRTTTYLDRFTFGVTKEEFDRMDVTSKDFTELSNTSIDLFNQLQETCAS